MGTLNSAQISEGLKNLPGWEYKDNALQKRFRFKEFMDGIRFVGRVAEIAERMDHHPDITINYTRITFSCTTHSEHAVTERDLRLATEIENAFKASPGQG
jgi:4a-hydroxytetrahydrobiopterin dehydratase